MHEVAEPGFAGLPLIPMSTAGGFDASRTVDADADETVDPAAKKPRARKGLRRGPVELITSATRSPAENRRSREIKYLILQGLRIPFVLLSIAAVLWWENWTLAVLFFCISIPLPWVSVVIANDGNEVRETRQRNVYKPAVARQAQLAAQQQAALEGGRDQGGGERHDPGTIDHED